MWRRKPQRSPPTYEDVRRVAQVLSRINAHLIERHFAISPDMAQEFMARLVEDGHFEQRAADGWRYPSPRKRRQRRSCATRKASAKTKVEEVIAEATAASGNVGATL